MPPTLDDLVFANYDGKPIDSSTLTHNFGRIVKCAGLRVRFHDLRHSYASLMLAAGVHPKVVSEALGHSTVATTLDIYSHASHPGFKRLLRSSLTPSCQWGRLERHGRASRGGMTGRFSYECPYSSVDKSTGLRRMKLLYMSKRLVEFFKWTDSRAQEVHYSQNRNAD